MRSDEGDNEQSGNNKEVGKKVGLGNALSGKIYNKTTG